MTGKEKCRELRRIRAGIAQDNDIGMTFEECGFERDCSGTCPKCEDELKQLDRALEARRAEGLPVKLGGYALETGGKTGGSDPVPTEKDDDTDINEILGEVSALDGWSDDGLKEF